VIYWVRGFESWIQIEAIAALWEAGYMTTTTGKIEHDADFIIVIYGRKIGIELKHWRKFMSDTLTPAVTQHPGADYYIFLHQLPCEFFENSKKMVNYYKTLPVWNDWYISLLSTEKEIFNIPDDWRYI